MKPYPVKISPELENQIHDVLMSLEIRPVDIKQVLIISSLCLSEDIYLDL